MKCKLSAWQNHFWLLPAGHQHVPLEGFWNLFFTWTFLENGLFSLWHWYLWWFLSFQKPQKMQLLSGGKFVKLFLKRLWVLQIAAKCTWRGGSIDKLIPPPLVDVNNGVEHVELNSFGVFYGVLVWVVVWLPTSEKNPQVSFHIEGKRAMFWVLGAQEAWWMMDNLSFSLMNKLANTPYLVFQACSTQFSPFDLSRSWL